MNKRMCVTLSVAEWEIMRPHMHKHETVVIVCVCGECAFIFFPNNVSLLLINLFFKH